MSITALNNYLNNANDFKKYIVYFISIFSVSMASDILR